MAAAYSFCPPSYRYSTVQQLVFHLDEAPLYSTVQVTVQKLAVKTPVRSTDHRSFVFTLGKLKTYKEKKKKLQYRSSFDYSYRYSYSAFNCKRRGEPLVNPLLLRAESGFCWKIWIRFFYGCGGCAVYFVFSTFLLFQIL